MKNRIELLGVAATCLLGASLASAWQQSSPPYVPPVYSPPVYSQGSIFGAPVSPAQNQVDSQTQMMNDLQNMLIENQNTLKQTVNNMPSYSYVAPPTTEAPSSTPLTQNFIQLAQPEVQPSMNTGYEPSAFTAPMMQPDLGDSEVSEDDID
jgi:hypothetical protein